MRRLLPGLVGYLTAAGAHLNTRDIEDTLAALPQYVRDACLNGATFAERIVTKRRALGLS
jgi:hypothetical protein